MGDAVLLVAAFASVPPVDLRDLLVAILLKEPPWAVPEPVAEQAASCSGVHFFISSGLQTAAFADLPFSGFSTQQDAGTQQLGGGVQQL